MFFQKILKGIWGIDDDQADAILEHGILCRWWDKAIAITPAEITAKLSQRNLYWHLNRYGEDDPAHGNEPFYDHTPFISTTAGTVERDVSNAANIIHSPFLTALDFATHTYSQTGYIFYGYVYTLGKKAVELQPFAEEVRELHVYTDYLPYHNEGEVTAKIIIPSVNLEKWARFDIETLLAQRTTGSEYVPALTRDNPGYLPPEQYANIRQVLL